ncbi:MAG: hypothetical protein JNL82_17335 [Myxococcales bacterium]|nr:hypothetical protein [Myxococcales bacterium]
MKKFVASLLVAPLLATSAPAMAAVGPHGAPPAAVGLGAVQVFWAAPAAGVAAAPAEGPASPPPAETETFESLIGQATEKFKDKDYAGSVALFERAYAVQNEPAILFNIGRIYEEAKNVEAAIGYYEKFIADESVDLKDREKAVQRLQILKTIIEIREKEKQKTDPQPKPQTDPVTQPKTDPQPTPEGPKTDQKPAQQGKLMRPIGYAMFGTGALLIIGGAIAGGLASAQHKAAVNAETLDERETANELGRSRAITADALFATGGVVAAIGVVLLVVPAIRKARAGKERAHQVTPQVSPTQVGIGYVHRF